MKIIRTDANQFIKPDDDPVPMVDGYWCWGYRWHKNEQRWGNHCIQYMFKNFVWMDSEELK